MLSAFSVVLVSLASARSLALWVEYQWSRELKTSEKWEISWTSVSSCESNRGCRARNVQKSRRIAPPGGRHRRTCKYGRHREEFPHRLSVRRRRRQICASWRCLPDASGPIVVLHRDSCELITPRKCAFPFMWQCSARINQTSPNMDGFFISAVRRRG